jgi:hypothetical protein
MNAKGPRADVTAGDDLSQDFTGMRLRFLLIVHLVPLSLEDFLCFTRLSAVLLQWPTFALW